LSGRGSGMDGGKLLEMWKEFNEGFRGREILFLLKIRMVV